MTTAEMKARQMISKRTTEQLVNDFELTDNINDVNISSVRGWIMDEIELVVKISKEDYRYFTAFWLMGVNENRKVDILANAIKNGTTLPKGHGRLIDADAYKEKVFRIFPCSDRDDSIIRRATELCLGGTKAVIVADKEGAGMTREEIIEVDKN